MSKTYRRMGNCNRWYNRPFTYGGLVPVDGEADEKRKREFHNDKLTHSSGNKTYKALCRKTRRNQWKYDAAMIMKDVDHDWIETKKLEKKHIWSVW